MYSVNPRETIYFFDNLFLYSSRRSLCKVHCYFLLVWFYRELLFLKWPSWTCITIDIFHVGVDEYICNVNGLLQLSYPLKKILFHGCKITNSKHRSKVSLPYHTVYLFSKLYKFLTFIKMKLRVYQWNKCCTSYT